MTAPDAGRAAAEPADSGQSGAPSAGHAEPRHPFDVAPPRRPAGTSAGVLRIDAPGLLTTVQDLGRGGLASLGVSRSGALDRGALRTANRLLGNDEGAAALEIALGGFAATALSDLWVAAAGAWGRLRIAGHDVDPYAAHPWPTGEELTWEPFTAGLRGYLAVRGGIEVPLSVGSRSADLLGGLGPAPLQAGDVVAVGDAAGPIPVAEVMPWGPPHDEGIEVALAAGPRADWFTDEAHRLLFERTWTVSAQADRVGLRLDGPPLPRLVPGELPSEGMVPGALQVPPDGRPVVLLADGPVTGGYPVIAVVADAALDLFAQVRPGTGIRFRHAR
ncbi:5-oxoprolinase subunit C family protein [Microbacterium lemovicicum]|uniref:5-oxoprolinase subunit C family protein n=1 Tax=Microbacterium lemovicicum TaxID=1072463 RepID=UPI00362BA1E2